MLSSQIQRLRGLFTSYASRSTKPNRRRHGVSAGHATASDMQVRNTETLEDRALLTDLLHTLLPAPGGQGDNFGLGVAIDGDVVAVGARQDDTEAQMSGKVYLVDRNSGEVTRTIANPTPDAGDLFGSRLAIAGETLVIGVYSDDVVEVDSGIAYVFNTTTGGLTATISNPTPSAADFFGDSVDVSGGTVVVGARRDDAFGIDSGAAYIFESDTGDLSQTLTTPTLEAGDFFGFAVATNGSLVAVSAPYDDTAASDSGVVYVFAANTGELVTTITNPTPAASDRFGWSVAMDGNLIAVGAQWDDEGADNSGVAYVFDAGTGGLVSTLSNPAPADLDLFGSSIDISENRVIVGARLDDNGADNSGAAHLFDALSGDLLSTIENPAPAPLDGFAEALSISGNSLVIGAYSDDTQDDGQGAAYVFEVPAPEPQTQLSLLKDINTAPSFNAQEVEQLTVIGDSAFYVVRRFTVDELWKTDGTVAGSTLLAALDRRTSSGYYVDSILELTAVGDTLYFNGHTQSGGHELWKSDGTVSGTSQVKDIYEGGNSGYPGELTDVNGTLYFRAYSPAGTELWKSDGTAAGTVLVKDIADGSLFPDELFNVNGTLYFRGRTAGEGGELWKSDGTAAGTVLVRDVNPGSDSSNPTNFAEVNGTFFFTAETAEHGKELWKSDGTTAGTVLVKDIYAGADSSNTFGITGFGGAAYFSATTASGGTELWRTDGTPEGTTQVLDIAAGADSSHPAFLTEVDGALFFRALTADAGFELWKSDGSAEGTTLVSDIVPGATSSHASLLLNIDETLYFRAETPETGYELWKSDGTAEGTTQVKDIALGTSSSFPQHFAALNDTLVFMANQREVWRSDGSFSGTQKISNLTGTATSFPGNVTEIGDSFFFSARSESGDELWKSDGTAEGTLLVKDIYAGEESSGPTSLANVNGTLFFGAGVPGDNQSLWKSDGTAAGTVLVRDIRAGSHDNLGELTEFKGSLYFRAYTNDSGHELWRSDGTHDGTVQVKDIWAGEFSSSPNYLTVSGETLYFTARTEGSGQELWKTDGTIAGTVQVKDIGPATDSSSPSNLIDVDGTLFFTAATSAGGRELWKSDGTSAGTVPLTDLPDNSSPSWLVDVEGTVFFSVGQELWKSDGTASGTIPFTDIYVSNLSTRPRAFTNVDGAVFFVAESDSGSHELWKTDGTDSGTIKLREVAPDSAVYSPNWLTNVDGTLYFTSASTGSSRELWESDGTAEGTVRAWDFGAGSDVRSLTVFGSQLVVEVTTPEFGTELWIAEEPAAPSGIVFSPNDSANSIDVGQEIGELATLDDNLGDRFTYEIVAGDGDADNAAFTLVNYSLRNAVPLTYSTDDTYDVRIRSTDVVGLFVEKSFTIFADDDSDGPEISLEGAQATQNVRQQQVLTWNITDVSGVASSETVVSQNGTEIFRSTDATGSFDFNSFGLGDYTIIVNATDNDNDRTDDQSSTTQEFSFTVTDEILQHVLYPTTSGGTIDYFGISIAIDGDLVLTGARQDDLSGVNAGAAYLHNRVTGELLATFLPPTSNANDRFGHVVALAGNYAVVGSYEGETSVTDSGVVYVFDVETGDLLHTLASPNAVTGGRFGVDIDIDGGRIIVGEDGGASNLGAGYIFDADSGALLHTIIAPNSEADDYFGGRVTIDGDLAGVAAIFDDTATVQGGAVYVYNANNGELQYSVTAPNAFTGDRFGGDAAIDNGYLVVGASRNDVGASDTGRAYIFNAETGDHISTLDNPTPAGNDRFGLTISIENELVAIGSSALGGAVGEVHLFRASDGQLLKSIEDPTNESGKLFGNGISVYASALGIGAALDSEKGKDAGAAYLYELGPYALSLSGTTVSEGSAGAIVGQFSQDGGLGTEATYELVGGDGDSGNAAFVIEGDELKSAVELNSETQATYSVRVRVTDEGGLSFEKVFTITVEKVFKLETMNLIGGGTVAATQRSDISETTLNFNEEIEFDADAFVVEKRGARGGIVTTTASTSLDTNGNTIVTLTFSGVFTRGTTGNLIDGNYQLSVDGSKIRKAGTTEMLDANGDGNAGGMYVFGDDEDDDFYALYGDVNGDRVVDAADKTAMRSTYRRRVGQAGYSAALDYDGDGDIDALDYLYFRRNYGDTMAFE